MTEGRLIGEVLDHLGVTAELAPDGLVSDVLVLMRVVNAETGKAALLIGATPSMDFILEVGLVQSAWLVLSADDVEDAD